MNTGSRVFCKIDLRFDHLRVARCPRVCILANFAGSLPTMNGDLTLPDELKLMIAPSLVISICKTRRHIAIRLLQHQRLTTRRISPPRGTDLDFQRLARRLMDRTEWNQFCEWIKGSLGPSLADTAFFDITRETERNWLRVMAMDYHQFANLCHNPNSGQYGGRRELVIELFPTADFSDPPQDMSDAALVRQPLTTGARALLAIRGQWASFGNLLVATHRLDRQIYEGLAELWLHFIQNLAQNPGQNPSLPRFVRRVWVISKNNDKPNSAYGPHKLDGRALGNIIRALKNQIGTRDVNVVF
ncbi:hypothetical protein AC579_4630 [Pseudocercospora musae]|uniref:Uncharacterized protein n=1 Tax=Pseudocercospora musae TaxID=113226 RepID=A0A139HJT8_9PEZI|nr:hypothetical protein AC579_4630 [Pseudocercospora musae]